MNFGGRRPAARVVGRFFSLLDEKLRLGTEGYSPAMLIRIEYAGGNADSFEQACECLDKLGELSISPKHVQRLTQRLGAERLAQRDADVALRQAGKLQPQHAQPPAVAVIHVDAGKLQLRAQDGLPGVHQPHWGDTKVGCFQTYSALASRHDPQPQPPAAFLDPPRVVRLCQEIAQVRCDPATRPTAEPVARRQGGRAERQRQCLLRTAVASTAPVEQFGWMLAAEATRRNFYNAPCRAVIGDGGNWIGPLGKAHFTGWTQVLDFVHLLTHLYAAAMAAHHGHKRQAWGLYERLLRAAWAGDVGQVQAQLLKHLWRLGPPTAHTPPEAPAAIVAKVLAYVNANAGRMSYPQYRRAGLPVSSAAVESLIKQFNRRVKGTEKFWLKGGAEAVLQVRAAYLSQDGRGQAFHAHRPRSRAVGQGRLKAAA